MADHCSLLQSFLSRKTLLVVSALMGLALTSSAGRARGDRAVTLQGNVESGSTGLAGYEVSLFASFVDHGSPWLLLGSDTSDSTGHFQITYWLPERLSGDQQPLLFVEATHGPVMLASAIGMGSSPPGEVVVNERTTVATGNAFAQFVDGRKIKGNTYGMINAVKMAANLADPQTGAVGVVLAIGAAGPLKTPLIGPPVPFK
jgi:hypothetical protein